MASIEGGASMMHIRVLGGMEVAVTPGAPVRVSGRRNEQLFSLLTLHAGATVADSEIWDALWPDELPVDPGAATRTYISRLRSVLPNGLVVRRPTGYRLDADPSAVDVWRFESLATSGVARARTNDREGAAAALREALELWSGEPWPLLSHLPRAESERLRLEELHLQAEEHMVAALLEDGRTAEACRRVVALVEAEPLRELRWELLMRARHLERNRPAAVRAFHDARRRMVGELGIEPSDRLRHLEGTILRGEQLPALFPDERSTSIQDRRDTSSVSGDLFGRDDFVELLDLEIRDAFEGGPGVVLVSGEAGIGKTSVLRRLREQLESDAMVIAGRCHRAEAKSPMRFVDELIEVLNGDVVHVDGTDRGAQAALFDRVSDLVLNRSDEVPVVLLIDDVHWADAGTLAVLAHIVDRRRRARVAVVLALRDAEVEHPAALDLVVDAAEHVGGFSRHQLGGLDAAAVAQLMERERGPVDVELVDRVMQLTGGNPFLVLELAGSIDPSARFSLPDGIHRLVHRRTEGLEQTSSYLLLAIGLNAHPAPLVLLQSGSPAGEAATVKGLEELIDRGLVIELTGGMGPEYDYVHAIYREAVVADAIAGRRLSVHHQLAIACDDLERRQGKEWTPWAALHWYRSGRLGDAARCHDSNVAAGEAAYVEASYHEALINFERALESRQWASRSSRDGGRLLLRIAESAHRCGDVGRRRTAAALALDQAVEQGDMDVVAGAAMTHAGPRSGFGAVDIDAMSMLERAARALHGCERPGLDAQVTSRLAQEIHHGGDHPAGRKLARVAVERAREHSEPALHAQALLGLAWTINHPDHFDERVAVIDEMIDAAVLSESAELELMAREWRCAALLEEGRAGELDVEFAVLEELLELAPVPALRVQVETLRAARMVLTGDLAATSALIEEVHRLSIRHEPSMAESVFGAQMFQLLRAQDQAANAVPVIRDMVDAFPEVLAWRCALACALSESGEKVEASRIASDILKGGLKALPRDVTWSQAMAALSEAVVNCDMVESVDAIVRELMPYSGRSLPLWFIVAGPSVDYHLGRLTLTAGDTEQAIRHLERAVEFDRKARSLPHQLLSEVELVRARERSGVASADEVLGLRDIASRARAHGLIRTARIAEDLAEVTTADRGG
ncbi:MAG: AAA family ATPase [Actinomycetia bacterium]|nr:AAA family ATPase [Actinomycetes bacterium]